MIENREVTKERKRNDMNNQVVRTMQNKLGVIAVTAGLALGFAAVARAALVLQYDSRNYVPGPWTDTSGSANNATQGTVGFQPTLTGTTPSGKPALTFDGVNDLLSL